MQLKPILPGSNNLPLTTRRFAYNLKQRMKHRKWATNHVSTYSGISVEEIKLFRNAKKSPTIKQVYILALVLETDINSMIQ